tara:strand:- start:772 stop:999 length:228 start_codon:yes stop_codon:yes gene_type:complete
MSKNDINVNLNGKRETEAVKIAEKNVHHCYLKYWTSDIDDVKAEITFHLENVSIEKLRVILEDVYAILLKKGVDK